MVCIVTEKMTESYLLQCQSKVLEKKKLWAA
jgi:hypothetical protein